MILTFDSGTGAVETVILKVCCHRLLLLNLMKQIGSHYNMSPFSILPPKDRSINEFYGKS